MRQDRKITGEARIGGLLTLIMRQLPYVAALMKINIAGIEEKQVEIPLSNLEEASITNLYLTRAYFRYLHRIHYAETKTPLG